MRRAVLAVAILAALAVGLDYLKTLGIPDTWPVFDQGGPGFVNPVTGRVYFSKWGYDVQVIDPATGQRYNHFRGGYSRALHCPEAGRIWFVPWIVWDRRDMVGVDDSADTVVATVFYPQRDDCGSPAYCATGGKFYAGEGAYVFDARTGALLDSIDTWCEDRAWDPRRNRLYLLSCGQLEIVDCRADTLLDTVLYLSNFAHDLFLHPDGRRLYCVGTRSGRSRAMVVDVEMLAVVDSIDLPLLSDDEEEVGLLYWEGEDCLYATGDNYSTDTTAVICCSGDSLLGSLVLGDVDGGAENTIDHKFYIDRFANTRSTVAVLERPDSVSDFIAPGADGVAWSPAGNRLCVPVNDTVYLYDGAPDTLVGFIHYWKLYPDALKWTEASGKFYAFAGSPAQSLAILDRNDSVLGVRSVGGVSLPAYSAERDRFYFGSESSLRVYDCALDSFLFDRRLPGNAYGTEPVLAADRDRLYVPCLDSIAVYDLDSDSVTGTIAGPGESGRGLAGLCPGANRLFLAVAGGARVEVIDTDADTLVRYVDCEPVTDLAASTTSPEAYVVVRQRYLPQRCYLLTLDAVTGEVARTLLLPRPVTDAFWVADFDRLYLRALGSGQIQVDVYGCREQAIIRSVRLTDPVVSGRPLYDPVRLRLWYQSDDSVVVFQCGPDSVIDRAAMGDAVLLGLDYARERVFAVADWRIEAWGNAPPGVTEGAPGDWRLGSGATVVWGLLCLPASSVGRGASSVLLDVTGRKVMDLKAGENDVSRLAPGVYFVRKWGQGTRGEGLGDKVVVTR